MRFLRSKLFIAVVSLFVLTGYGYDAVGDCCGDHNVTQTENANGAPTNRTPSNADDCQCLCHQVISHLGGEPVRMPGAVLVSAEFVTDADEFPPDAVPLSIDHPPQIA